MEQARQERSEPTSARYEALVAEIVPKLRRLGPQLSEETLRQTAERLAAHRLASEETAASGPFHPTRTPPYPSFPAHDDGIVSPLDDEKVRHLAVSLAHRMRPVSQHLSEGELVSLATRMAVLETSAPPHAGSADRSPAPLTAATHRGAEMGAPGAPGAPGDAGRSPEYDAATVTAVAERYARADAALTNYPWLGLLVGGGLGYVAGLVTSHALDMRVDNAVTTGIVLVLFGATFGLLLGRAKGNIESRRLREEARETLAAADRERAAAEEQP